VKTKALLQLNTACTTQLIANFNLPYSDIKLLDIEGCIKDHTFPVLVYLHLHRLFTRTELYILLIPHTSYTVEFHPKYPTYFITLLLSVDTISRYIYVSPESLAQFLAPVLFCKYILTKPI
jgi:hypothetical protein